MPNKTTGSVKEWISQVINDNREQMEQDLQMLEPKERLSMLEKLMGYVIPKQAPTTPDDMIEKERKMMQELLLDTPDEFVNRVADRLTFLQSKDNENKIEQY